MTYQEFKDAVVRYAGQRQIGEYELYFTERDSAKVEIYKEEIKSYKTESGMGICFRCIADGKAGYASTENLTAEEAESLVLRAWDNAVSIESEEECFIHEPGDSYAAVEQDGGAAPQGTRLVEAALGLQRELYQADARVIDGTQSFVAYGEEKYAICNSKGLDLEDRVSYSICYAMPLVSEGGEMYDGLKDKMGRLEDFDLKAIAGEAVEDAVSTIGAGGVSSGSYNVVFSNRVMATLLAAYAPVFSAEAAQQGMSLLNGREGEKIAADMVTITDDPRYEGGVVKRTFDGEGVAAYEKNVVEQGRLVTLLHNLKTAAAEIHRKRQQGFLLLSGWSQSLPLLHSARGGDPGGYPGTGRGGNLCDGGVRTTRGDKFCHRGFFPLFQGFFGQGGKEGSSREKLYGFRQFLYPAEGYSGGGSGSGFPRQQFRIPLGAGAGTGCGRGVRRPLNRSM